MIKYLSRTNPKKLAGKTGILRIDLNVEPGEEKESYRVLAVLPTIKRLLKDRAKVVLISHRGRPHGRDRKYSLRPFAGILERKLQHKVVFCPNLDFQKIKNEILNSKPGAIFLLENLRFYPGEGKNDPKFAQKLAFLGDFYVNDAFAVSHRKEASVAAITRSLPAYAGLGLEREIVNLDRVMRRHKHPLTIIIGGAKISDKLGILKYFWNKASYFLIAGGPANTFFAAEGLPIGNSVYDKYAIPLVKKYLGSGKIILPTDAKMDGNKILDIGSHTTHSFGEIIRRSRTIIWNGPPGLYEKKGFEHGSYWLARAVAGSRAFSVVGGGETTAILVKLNLINKVGFVSTGGGAMLEYLSGKKLPGIEALK